MVQLARSVARKFKARANPRTRVTIKVTVRGGYPGRPDKDRPNNRREKPQPLKLLEFQYMLSDFPGFLAWRTRLCSPLYQFYPIVDLPAIAYNMASTIAPIAWEEEKLCTT